MGTPGNVADMTDTTAYVVMEGKDINKTTHVSSTGNSSSFLPVSPKMTSTMIIPDEARRKPDNSNNSQNE